LEKIKSRRDLKTKVLSLLKTSDIDQALSELSHFSPRRVINPLFSLFCSQDEGIRWKAITAMGFIVSTIASKDMESARIVMRRLMWSLNDESGGIGWGAPEAMGEIMACHEGLANEFVHILVSYIREDGNFIEYELLQRGVLWGIGRLAQVMPDILRQRNIEHMLLLHLTSSDPIIRALAVWTIGLIGIEESRPRVQTLLTDNTKVQIYFNRNLVIRTIAKIAEEALAQVEDCRGA